MCSAKAPDGDIPAQAGISLRFPHIDQLLAERPTISWLELLSDNHMVIDRRLQAKTADLREHYPMALHGVGLNLGGADPLDKRYLAQLKQLANSLEISRISEHCSFSAHNGEHFHDLLPLPFTQDAAQHIAERIYQAQELLGQRLLIENLSSYLAYNDAEMSEAEFVSYVADLADCDLIVDVNNLHVNQVNHGWDAKSALTTFPSARIKEFHLSGHKKVKTEQLNYAIDTHGTAVPDEVWALYQFAVTVHGASPSLIEWDQQLPPLERLLAEATQANKILNQHSI